MNLTQKKKTSFRMPYRYDLIIHLCTLILAVFGLFMVASATMGLASGNVMTLMKTINETAGVHGSGISGHGDDGTLVYV